MNTIPVYTTYHDHTACVELLIAMRGVLAECTPWCALSRSME